MKLTKILTEATIEDYEAIETKDFQSRHGSRPMPNVPDTISVSAWSEGAEMVFAFHHTRQSAAENFVAKFLMQQQLPYDNITSEQVGEYEDDWIEVTATVRFGH